MAKTDPEPTRSSGCDWLEDAGAATDEREVLSLVIVWSATKADRSGEVALFDSDAPYVLGRGEPAPGEFAVRFYRQRPGVLLPTAPLEASGISRRQLRVLAHRDHLEFERIGRCPVLVGSTSVERGVLHPGECLTLRGQLVLYCMRRPVAFPPPRQLSPDAFHEFGMPDAFGMVGEGRAAWELREQQAFCAGSDAHVLLLGESGTGKELAARAIHAASRRGHRPLVARNASTLPAGIVDAELFGNVKNYPNPGMEARPGLIGAAHESTLFLDEIGELGVDLQAHLLRVLDRGEYQRLGEARPLRADLRVIGATNRDPAELKHDLAARFLLRVLVPGLNDRREDIPLIIQHLVRRAAKQSPELCRRFLDPETNRVRVDPALVEALVCHEYTGHVRELERFLWQSMAESTGSFLALTSTLARDIRRVAPVLAPASLDAETVRECLRRHGGKVSRACVELGLPSRYALYRLMRKLGIDAQGSEEAKETGPAA